MRTQHVSKISENGGAGGVRVVIGIGFFFVAFGVPY